uniref:F-box domain-containing protein n=1 Tax=Romanomermis culicivorax TaxID=13658 RepID=A0A915K4Z8_ROMCU
MPFIGQDWRAPGETWIKTTEGWEQMKLRPLRTCSDVSLEGKYDRIHTDSESSNDNSQSLPPIFDNNSVSPIVEFGLDNSIEDAFDWLPHCFVKTSKSKEFVGCASMTEAFLKLDMSRAVTDVKRFNYVCKVAQIFVCQKLKHLSGSGRKILLSLIEAIVMHCLTNFKELNSIRMLVNECVVGLNGYQHYCGSKSLLSTHKDTISNLFNMLTNVPYKSPAECDEDSVTFLDLPIECLRSILKQLPDHESLLTAAQTDAALKTLVHAETNLWRDLVKFHFDQGLGHPCVGDNAPSVRVTPQQFIEMLLYS